MENNNCNGAGPHTPGEVRVLPHSNAPLHGNDILCRACWRRAITYNAERNRELGIKTLAQGVAYPTPDWDAAEVYES